MAAQPSFWGTLADREGTPSGRARVRRETHSPARQHYRQIPLPEGQRLSLPADFFQEVLVESRLNAAGAVQGEAHAVPDVVEDSLLTLIRIAIDGLMSLHEDDGDPIATNHAYQSARAVVESAYGRFFTCKEPHAKQLPTPIVTTDERGGVRLSWQSGERHVRTSFAAAENLRSYLYFESPTEHDVEGLQPYTLSKRLHWMLEA
jgi:hypothetical protein